jgi:2-polyprenyl-3-methyl-5-hydroxy-6-metoxy-1,4-benzoquinol methylase
MGIDPRHVRPDRRGAKVTGQRVDREIAHGRYLAASDPETMWGWGTPAGQRRASRRARIIAEGGGLGPGVRALEVGCGTGLFTSYFAETGAKIVAIDISPELLALARHRALPIDRVSFVLGRFEELAADRQFDAIVGSSVLHHLELESALPHLFRLVKPGGWCSFAEPNMLNPQVFLERHVPALRKRLHVSPDETAFVRWSFAQMLREHGFERIAIAPFDWLHPFTPTPLIATVLAAGAVFERVPFVREFSGSLAIRFCRPAMR